MSILCDGTDVNDIIDEFGDTVTIRTITQSAINEYGDQTETTSDVTGVPAIVQTYSSNDDEVREGVYSAGEIVFTFKNDRTDIIPGNRIVYDSKVFEINEVRKSTASNTTYLLQATVKKI